MENLFKEIENDSLTGVKKLVGLYEKYYKGSGDELQDIINDGVGYCIFNNGADDILRFLAAKAKKIKHKNNE